MRSKNKKNRNKITKLIEDSNCGKFEKQEKYTDFGEAENVKNNIGVEISADFSSKKEETDDETLSNKSDAKEEFVTSPEIDVKQNGHVKQNGQSTSVTHRKSIDDSIVVEANSSDITLDEVSEPNIKLDEGNNPNDELDEATKPCVKLKETTKPDIKLDNANESNINLDNITKPNIMLDENTRTNIKPELPKFVATVETPFSRLFDQSLQSAEKIDYEDKPGNNCTEHDLDLEFWCADHKQIFCKKCLNIYHKKCDWCLIEDCNMVNECKKSRMKYAFKFLEVQKQFGRFCSKITKLQEMVASIQELEKTLLSVHRDFDLSISKSYLHLQDLKFFHELVDQGQPYDKPEILKILNGIYGELDQFFSVNYVLPPSPLYRIIDMFEVTVSVYLCRFPFLLVNKLNTNY